MTKQNKNVFAMFFELKVSFTVYFLNDKKRVFIKSKETVAIAKSTLFNIHRTCRQ